MIVDSLRLSLLSTADEIEQHSEFEQFMRSHYLALSLTYSRRPFFYKSALKLNRLMVSFSLLSYYFNSTFPLLSEVKELCVARNFCSKNSLESIFLLFRALGFMEVGAHPEDSRLRVYKPSLEACREVRGILASTTTPLSAVYTQSPGLGELLSLSDYEYLSIYFKGFSTLLGNGMTIDLLLPECLWLVKRDAGHMLMLALYFDVGNGAGDAPGFRSSSYFSLARELSVSKSHVIRLVQEGAERGYFKIHSKTNLEVLPAFLQLSRRFMALSFAIGLHSVRLGQADVA